MEFYKLGIKSPPRLQQFSTGSSMIKTRPLGKWQVFFIGTISQDNLINCKMINMIINDDQWSSMLIVAAMGKWRGILFMGMISQDNLMTCKMIKLMINADSCSHGKVTGLLISQDNLINFIWSSMIKLIISDHSSVPGKVTGLPTVDWAWNGSRAQGINL